MTNMQDENTATSGILLKIENVDTIPFPKQFREALETDHALMVLIKKDKVVKIFPIESNKIAFLSVEVGRLTNDFLTNLSRTFKESGLSNLLFSTGVCLIESRCFYECYFDQNQLKVSMDKFKEMLSSIPGVEKVILNEYNL